MVIDLTKYCGSVRNWNTHLLAAEIAQHRSEYIEFDLNCEKWDTNVNGIRKIIEEVFNALDIKQEVIIRYTGSNSLLSKTGFSRFFDLEYYNPPQKIGYGQFVGRPDSNRMRCLLKHLTWQHKNKGIATFHVKPDLVNEYSSDFIQFVWEDPIGWHKIKNALPYNDADDTFLSNLYKSQTVHDQVKIDFEKQLHSLYSQICAEVICETNPRGSIFFITEKTLRAFLYGAIPLVVSNKGFEQNLKDLGFDIFDDVIDKTYDQHEDQTRIDGVYSSLEGILVHKDSIWLQSLEDRFWHNRQRAIQYIMEN